MPLTGFIKYQQTLVGCRLAVLTIILWIRRQLTSRILYLEI